MQKYLFFIACFTVLFYTTEARRPNPKFSIPTDVSIDNGKLVATLTTPIGFEPCPIVIIVPGSGPTDKDGNSVAGVKTDGYKKLADSLKNRGIASLRIDKRGVGLSADSTMKEQDLTFDTYIEDLKKWLIYLNEEQPRFTKKIIAGHSEGSLVGMICANQADAFISIAGAGEPIQNTLKKQLKGKLGPLENTVYKQIDSLVKGQSVTCSNPALMSLLRPSVQPYMMSWFKYNPSKEIAKLKVPCLIIQGATDLQVSKADAILLSKANKKAKLKIIATMNHALVDSKLEASENIKTYNQPELPLNKDLVKSIADFCLRLK